MRSTGATATLTLECAVWYRDLLTHSYGRIPTRYFESYLSFVVGGTARVSVNRRKSGRAFFEVKIGEESIPEVTDFLNKAGIAFNIRYNQIVTFNVNVHELNEKKAVHEWLVARIAPKNLLKPAP